MNMALFGSAFVTLFVIMDPIGIIPVFLALVGKRPGAELRRLAWQAALTSLLVIAVFAAFGAQILAYLNISLPALRVAGGLLLLLVALQLLVSGSLPTATDEDASIAMVPLGTPLLAGPGAIVVVIIMVQASTGAADLLAIAAAIVSIHLIIWACLYFSPALARLITPAGITVVSRVTGVLLAAIAVQLIATGVHEFIEQWSG